MYLKKRQPTWLNLYPRRQCLHRLFHTRANIRTFQVNFPIPPVGHPEGPDCHSSESKSFLFSRNRSIIVCDVPSQWAAICFNIPISKRMRQAFLNWISGNCSNNVRMISPVSSETMQETFCEGKEGSTSRYRRSDVIETRLQT